MYDHLIKNKNNSKIPNIYDEIHESLDDKFQYKMFTDLHLTLDDLYFIKRYVLPQKITRQHYNDIVYGNDPIYHKVIVSNDTDKIVRVNKVILRYKNRYINVSGLRTIVVNHSDFKCAVCGSPITEGRLFCFKDDYPEDVDKLSLIWSIAYIATLNGGGKRFMTKDHFVPKAKRGANNIRNMVSMCSLCNNRKADYDLLMKVNNNPYIQNYEI